MWRLAPVPRDGYDRLPPEAARRLLAAHALLGQRGGVGRRAFAASLFRDRHKARPIGGQAFDVAATALRTGFFRGRAGQFLQQFADPAFGAKADVRGFPLSLQVPRLPIVGFQRQRLVSDVLGFIALRDC